MRTAVRIAVLTLAAAAPLAAQDFVRDRETIGTDTTFGPGVTEVSASGASIRLQLARPAHILAIVLTPTAAPRVVEPRRSESRETNAGRPWIDLYATNATSGNTQTGYSMGNGSAAPGPRGSAGSRSADRATAANATVAYRGAGNTVALVVLADQKWDLHAVEQSLPQATIDPLEAARVLATALTQTREGAWAGYIIRY